MYLLMDIIFILTAAIKSVPPFQILDTSSSEDLLTHHYLSRRAHGAPEKSKTQQQPAPQITIACVIRLLSRPDADHKQCHGSDGHRQDIGNGCGPLMCL